MGALGYAVLPASEDDPSPIADPIAYIPDQHDCPLPCTVDYANVHKWTPYYSVDRLQRCQLPMLLQFSVLHPLDDPLTSVLIRSCVLGDNPAAAGDRTIINATSITIDNPKNGSGLVEVSLDVAPACFINGEETNAKLTLTSGGGAGSGAEIAGLLDGMKEFFSTKENCDETYLFAYHKKTVAGVYIGPGLGKPTVASALQAVASKFQSGNSIANRTFAQICGSESRPESVFGLSIDTTGDIAGVQKAAAGWSQGNCAAEDHPASPLQQETLDIKLFDIISAPLVDTYNGTSNGTSNSRPPAILRRQHRRANNHRSRTSAFAKRATCRYIQVVSGDGCGSLAAKCGISGAEFMSYNTKANLCSTLQVDDYVCCSAGDPYTPPKPDPPAPNPDGTCATHLIVNGDTCAKLAQTYGLTVDEIESFNKGRTWGWTDCPGMMLQYNMCLSKGIPPLPPPQQGLQCGPQVPGTTLPTDPSVSLADLNPCPLKACCSNWGFCGPFPAHCDIHAPPGGGPGTKLPEFESSCISNCGNEIKQNSGPPATFSRIGYYESWNMGRKCLWLKAENANTDGTYTHIHWAFAEIDPATWKVVIKDPHNQWEAFKKLPNVKRIVSFGGWAYSTEPATYNIIRQAIIANREAFATNVAQFVTDQGIDGVDIDWEYPGAPDILVDGQPIGQATDGLYYLKFLISLKQKLGSKSVSIAAPASYWYLKAFPIDRIAEAIDYIVYMTYDLHGQWDYGNVNAFDSCPSGKCIRSHVTKAGVANNKIFVGEASYGRSFHMAVDGCWGPLCDFTGSRTQSDAKPGRCTETGGYISNAEINDIAQTGQGQQFHDGESNTDVLLYQGDYISYMTPVTKETRRADWKGLNFAGSIDWAVDLQAYGKEDMETPPNRPSTGEQGCISGESNDLNADEVCQFACNYGFCPESICTCTLTGTVKSLPQEVSSRDFIAWDDFDVDLARLCKFTCKYGFCPSTTCGEPVVDEWDDGSTDSGPTGGLWDKEDNFAKNSQQCQIFKSGKNRDASVQQCMTACYTAIQQAKEEDRTTNYGCVGFWPLNQEIPWTQYPGTRDPDMIYATGRCSCDNGLINAIADTVIEALPIIAQIGCYMVMSAFKLVLDVGLEFIPGVGKILDAGLDAVTTAAQLVSYAYPPGEDPQGAFEWWLSPCGGSDLVPDDIKNVFGILSTVADGVSSFKEPKNIKKGSGKKGDSANPKDRSKPKAGTGSGPNGTGSGGVTKKRKCNVSPAKSTTILGRAKNTLRVQSCVGPPGGVSTTQKDEMVITSLAFGAQPTVVEKTCSQKWSQACYHYSSAIAQNSQWDTLKCVHGNVKNPEDKRPAPVKWYDAHNETWRNTADRQHDACQADEFPPRYLLSDTSPEMLNAGSKGGQLIRYLPDDENSGGGSMWFGVCFIPHIEDWTITEFRRRWNMGGTSNMGTRTKNGVLQRLNKVPVDVNPSFRISWYEHSTRPLFEAGMWDNPCWPKAKAANDPGFALFSWDSWYNAQHPHLYDFSQAYEKGKNGA
ncbi:class V chitinase Chi100 [Thozetella sp. PMI_491]|nr:class V chitinase Chi100 [Thozetella sp. PMI_491]